MPDPLLTSWRPGDPLLADWEPGDPLYARPHESDLDHLSYTEGSVRVRPPTHTRLYDPCPPLCWHYREGAYGNGMRWSPDWPILRFPPEGLCITGPGYLY
jgi:hypothetical protein